MQQVEGAQDLGSTAVPMTGSERQLKTQGWLWGHSCNHGREHRAALPAAQPDLATYFSFLPEHLVLTHSVLLALCFNSLLPLG